MSDTTSAVTSEDDPVAAAIAAFEPDVLTMLNGDFGDSVLLIGRVLGERPDATAARVVALDRRGADLVVTDPAGDHRRRVDYADEVADLDQLTAELFALVGRARELSGEEGTTSAELAMQEMTSIRTFLTHVVAVDDVHPHLRQVTFGGGDLATFSPAGPDTFLYVLLPPPGRSDLTIDQGFTWSGYEEMTEAERPVGAYYTLRRWRPERHELDVLCVLHDDAGPASAWAARARPGDPVALWGPRTAYAPPPATDRYLLVADETGLPAVAAILESLPDGTGAQVVAEVDNPDERQQLPSSPSVEVTWLYREGAPAGTTTLLPDAVRALPWPGGVPYVWGGGESRAMTAVRRYVRGERGLAREQVSLVAYWRHTDHATDPDEDDDA
jgi:NADPH-dependent ferric siderophore reductase